jgi:hypothetical protein
MTSPTGLPRASQPGEPAAEQQTPFRFYDNRQKYLAFVNTCNEKAVVARRAAIDLSALKPKPPALRMFDAGMGDATVLTRLMGSMHRQFPTVPLLAVAKEISLEDVRLGLEKMPDRFREHPHMVFAVTNLSYMEAPLLRARDGSPTELSWHMVPLRGQNTYEYIEQIEALAPMLSQQWQTRPNPKTGNPSVVRPSVVVLYREDHEFILDSVIPNPNTPIGGFDFILASQPWRARTSASFKARKVLAPLVRNLRRGGRLVTVQSYGQDPGLEIVQHLWPDENPFQVGRHQLVEALKEELGAELDQFIVDDPPDDQAVFQYQMHTLPSEIGDRIGTSTLFAAWNAAIYVNQIEEERLDPVVTTGSYLDATQAVLHRHGGLWFNDEAFVVIRRD